MAHRVVSFVMCPECKVSTKRENLPGHLAAVHGIGEAPREEARPQAIRGPRAPAGGPTRGEARSMGRLLRRRPWEGKASLLDEARHREPRRVYLAMLEAALEDRPEDGPLWALYAMELAADEKWRKAEEPLRRAIRLWGDPEPTLYGAMGRCLLELGRLEEAEGCLRRFLEHQPGDIRGITDLGVCLEGMGRLREYVGFLEEMLQRKPGHRLALLMAGIGWTRLGDSARAVGCLDRLLESGPERTLASLAHHHKSVVLAHQGNYAQALEEARRAWKMDRRREEYRAFYGMMLVLNGSREEGIRELEEAMERADLEEWVEEAEDMRGPITPGARRVAEDVMRVLQSERGEAPGPEPVPLAVSKSL